MESDPPARPWVRRSVAIGGVVLLTAIIVAGVATSGGLPVGADATAEPTSDAVATVSSDGSPEADGTGVTVAVVDTGIDDDHPDLRGRVVDRIDLTGDEPTHPANGTDASGHGTYMAGVVGGAGLAGEHAGAAPGVEFVDVRILVDSGDRNVDESRVVAGIEYAVTEADADIVLLSLDSIGAEPEAIETGVERATDRGALVVASAGNRGGPRRITTPGTSDAALTVGATDGSGRPLDRASGGPTLDGRFKPDLLAPGTGIDGPRAEYDGESARYATRTGTSVSTAVVAGAAARLLASEPDRSPSAVERRLTSTARPIDGASGHGAASGVVDPDRALDPDVVGDGVVDVGPIVDDEPVTRTVTLENRGNERQTLSFDTSLENLDTGDRVDGALSVNRSRVSLTPGERATLAVRIDGAIPSGAHAGSIRYTVGGEPRSIAVGFVRGGTVTVEKRSLTPGDRVDGNELLVFTEADTHTELLEFENGTASFLAGGGTYVLWSAGVDEPTDSLVFLSERVRVDGDTHVVLDESETVPAGVDVAPLVERYGPLENRSVSASMVTRKGDSTQRLSRLTRDADGRTVRVSPDPDTSFTTAALLTTPTDDGGLDASDVFHVSSHHETARWASPREVRPRELETTTYRFARTTVDRTPEVQERASVRRTQHGRQLSWFDVGDRSVQTVHRTPEIDHDRHLRADGWRASLADPDRTRALSHPFIATADVSVGDGTASIEARPLADGAGTELYTAGEHTISVAVDGTAVAERRGSDPVIELADVPLSGADPPSDDSAAGNWSTDDSTSGADDPSTGREARTGADELSVRIAGHDPDGRLSTWTRGEVTIRGADLDPAASIPLVRDVRVENATPTNAAGPGAVPIRIETDARRAIADATVWHATSDVDAPPWENETAWDGRPARFGHDGLRTTVDVPADAETVSLAVAVRTAEGSVVRTATANAFHVGSAPNTSTRLIRGHLRTADGDPAANDTVVADPVDGESPTVAETDSEGYVEIEVPKGTRYDVHYRRGDLWTTDRPGDRSRPDFHTLGRVDVSEDVDVGRTLPEPTRLDVVVGDERDLPVANATVRVAHRAGNASTAVELETDANGTVRLGATDGILLGTATEPGTTADGETHADGAVAIEVTAPDERAFVEATARRTVTLEGRNATERFVLDTEPPAAALSTSRTWMVNGTPTTLDASGSDVPAGPAEYRWDLDGDGTTDRVTDDPRIRYPPDVGVSEPTVTVVDAAGKRDTASASAITVTERG